MSETDWDYDGKRIRLAPLARWNVGQLRETSVILRLEYAADETEAMREVLAAVQVWIHPNDAVALGQALLDLGRKLLAPAPPHTPVS